MNTFDAVDMAELIASAYPWDRERTSASAKAVGFGTEGGRIRSVITESLRI
jgi:hypothetical protein